MRWLADEWDHVSAQTIRHGWIHAGIVPDLFVNGLRQMDSGVDVDFKTAVADFENSIRDANNNTTLQTSLQRLRTLFQWMIKKYVAPYCHSLFAFTLIIFCCMQPTDEFDESPASVVHDIMERNGVADQKDAEKMIAVILLLHFILQFSPTPSILSDRIWNKTT